MPQRQKILIVDDSKLSRDINVFLLEGIDAEIVTAESGEESIVKAAAEDFDLILMDVVMPGIDGFEAVKRIKKDARNKNTPVIFITAMSGDEVEVIKGLSLGAIDFVTKPISKEILCLKAANLLNLQKNRRDLELANKELKEEITEFKKSEKN